MPSVLRMDPLTPQLLSSPALTLTLEQDMYLKAILEIACSDSRFAEKAYLAISKVLAGSQPVVPSVSSLSPASAVIGSESFDLHVIGMNFTPTSVIVFNGFDEPTTFVSPTELTTGVNMPLWLAPATVPVAVNTDGILSDPLNFTFTDVAADTASVKKVQYVEKPKVEEKKK